MSELIRSGPVSMWGPHGAGRATAGFPSTRAEPSRNRVIVVGWRGARPAGLPGSVTFERVEWLSWRSCRTAGTIVIGPAAMENSEPSELVPLIAAVGCRVLLCGDRCEAPAAVAWALAGIGEYVREAALPAALAHDSRSLRPVAALVIVRDRLDEVRRHRSGPPGRSEKSRAARETAAQRGAARAHAIVGALPQIPSMNNALLASAAGVGETTLDRWSRDLWGVPPGVVLDLYAATVIVELSALGVPSERMARILGYAHRRSLDDVVERHGRGPLRLRDRRK